MSITKEIIITELAEKRKIEEFIKNTAKTNAPSLDDLAQDIYVYLLEYDEDKIIGMYERNELEYFISRMITNQYISTSSPYYTKYKKFINSSTPIEEEYNNITESNEWMIQTERKSQAD